MSSFNFMVFVSVHVTFAKFSDAWVQKLCLEWFECDRLLVEQLAKVDPSTMSHNQKLAFWINLYNALLMHVRFP